MHSLLHYNVAQYIINTDTNTLQIQIYIQIQIHACPPSVHFVLHYCFHYNVALLYITKNYSTVQCKGLPLSDTNTNTNRIYKYNILQRSASQYSVKGCLSVIHGPLAESDQADSSGTSSELLFVLGQASEKILKRIEGTIQKYSSCTPKTDVQ